MFFSKENWRQLENVERYGPNYYNLLIKVTCALLDHMKSIDIRSPLRPACIIVVKRCEIGCYWLLI